MTSALEKIDATTVKLTVNLTQEDLAPSMEHAYEHVGKQVQIPGFRKGKVPAKVLEQRVGKGAIIEHAVNDGLPGWYAAAVEEQGVRPFGQPEVNITKIPGSVEGDDDIEFEALLRLTFKPLMHLDVLPGAESVISLLLGLVREVFQKVAHHLATR